MAGGVAPTVPVVPPLLVAEVIEGGNLGFSTVKDANGRRNLVPSPGRQVQSSTMFSSTGEQTSIDPIGTAAFADICALYVFSGSLVNPTRFMGEVEELRMETVRLELRWTEYIPGLKEMLAVMNYLIGGVSLFPADKNILDFYSTGSGPIVSGPNELGYYWFINSYMMKYVQEAA